MGQKKSKKPGASTAGPAGVERSRSFFRGKAFHLILILLVGFLAYSNTFQAPFQWDSKKQVQENLFVRNLDNFSALLKGQEFSPQAGFHYNARRIVGYFTFALNYAAGGSGAAGYRAVNLGIHLFNGFLVYLLVLLTFETPYFRTTDREKQAHDDPSPLRLDSQRSLIALFSALLFVAHPIQTEAVTFIVQRLTSLAAMFYLLSVVFYLKGRLITKEARGYRQEAMGKKERQHEQPSSVAVSSVPIAHRLSPIAYYFFAFIAAVLAMKTKEIAFTLPLIIVMYEFSFFRSSLRKKLAVLIPMLLTLAIIPLSIIGTGQSLGEVLSDLGEKTRLQTALPRWDYFLTQMRVITTYIRLLFLPAGQNLDYDYPVYHSLFSPPVFASFLFLTAILGAGVYLILKSRVHSAKSKEQEAASEKQGTASPGLPLSKARLNSELYALCPMPYAAYYRLIAFGIFWFFITLSVESSVIPIVDVIFEHRVYLPSVGAFTAITTVVFLAVERLKPAGAGKFLVPAFSLVVIALSVTTYARNLVWRSEVSLWQDVVAKSPNKARGHSILGVYYAQEGKTAEAINEFETAIRLDPPYVDAHKNLARAFYAQGRLDHAEREYKRVLSLKEDHADARNDLGCIYFIQGRLQDAMGELEEAAKINPESAMVHTNLGKVYYSLGRFDAAIEEFRTAAKLAPDSPAARQNLENASARLRGKTARDGR